MSAHRAESLASSWHSRANSHRSPLMRSVVLALASATNRRMAVSASRPIAAYSPLRERERPMVIFIFLEEPGVSVKAVGVGSFVAFNDGIWRRERSNALASGLGSRARMPGSLHSAYSGRDDTKKGEQ